MPLMACLENGAAACGSQRGGGNLYRGPPRFLRMLFGMRASHDENASGREELGEAGYYHDQDEEDKKNQIRAKDQCQYQHQHHQYPYQYPTAAPWPAAQKAPVIATVDSAEKDKAEAGSESDEDVDKVSEKDESTAAAPRYETSPSPYSQAIKN